MKAYLLIGTMLLCLWWRSYGYEPSLYEAERLQTAEKLLASVPIGMLEDIEEKLLRQENNAENERQRFCIQYLLYQLRVLAKKNESTSLTTNAHYILRSL